MRSLLTWPGATGALVIAVVAGLLLWFLVSRESTEDAKPFIDAIPVTIEVEAVVAARTKSNLQYSCGIVALQMSNRTVESLKKSGLDFLAGARQARGHTGNTDWRWKYSEWRKTPVPDAGPESRMAAASECFTDGSGQKEKDLMKGIWHAAQAPGGYYSYLHTYAEIYVLPELRLLVFVVDTQ